MTYFFETYGCQMNQAESAALEQILINRGWTASDTPETADLAVINTCSVRATAENRVFGRLGWFTALKAVRSRIRDCKKESFPYAAQTAAAGKPTITIVVTGCMAERMLKTLQQSYPAVDYVVGNFQKSHFSDIAQAVEKNTEHILLEQDETYSFAPLSYEKGAFSAFVPIMHGCNNFCTYCIVPYVRGREVSRNPAEIFAELDALTERGVCEITLLGQNVNSYHYTQDTHDIDFPVLIQKIAEHLKKTDSSIKWIRFMSSHPKDLSDRLLDVIAQERVLCRHIHLPVQHGSSKILSAMNRKYTREQYLSLVDRIRRKLPDVSLSTDILIGFPGETEDDFAQTVSLMQTVGYEAAYMYYYNPREGTPAAEYPNQIPISIKKARLQQIIDMQLEITRAKMAKRIGETVLALAEAVSRDNDTELLTRTERDERIVVTAGKEQIGTFIKIKITELTGNTFRGIVITEGI